MDLFESAKQQLLDGACLLRGFALPCEVIVLDDLKRIIAAAPLRHMAVPSGAMMSVATTSCGDLGWVSDKKGYRYASQDPISGKPWPAMLASFLALATQAADEAGFAHFVPDACLINQYKIGARMGLHQDKDEQDFSQPIVSVSLGCAAIFQFGGFVRTDKILKIQLNHGDVLVFGGASRKRFHGVLPLKAGKHALLGERRINLTFRKAA